MSLSLILPHSSAKVCTGFLLKLVFLVGVENTGLGLTWQGENLNQPEMSGDVSVHCPVPGSCLAPDTGCLVIRFSASQLTCGDGVK